MQPSCAIIKSESEPVLPANLQKVNATAGVSESCSATVADNAVTAAPVRGQTGIRVSLAGVGARAFLESEEVDIEVLIEGKGLLTEDMEA
jgi:hypothetical protein